MSERIGTTDAEWALIGPLLPPERGCGCRPGSDNRAFFDGMMWMSGTGAQWRRLPDEYGKWNSVFRRYRRWVETGVFDALLETLAELAGRDRAADMIDSTVVRAHHCAAGIKMDALRAEITFTGTRAVIPSRRGRRSPALHSQPRHTWRNRIERMFNKLKNWRCVAARYDKTAASYLGFVSIAPAFLWISFVHGR